MTRSDSFYANIWIAGSAADAERLCRDYCNRVGLCVTVTPTVFIYTGGAQSGVLVRLFNYPKFPAERDSIRDKARDLAEHLRQGLYQESFSVEFPDVTEWVDLTSVSRSSLHPEATP